MIVVDHYDVVVIGTCSQNDAVCLKYFSRFRFHPLDSTVLYQQLVNH